MLYSTKELRGLEPAARDGTIGKLREVYFDDARWVIRHLVIDTGGWLGGRNVLVSPHSIERLDRENRRLRIALTRRQIEDAPGVETDRPVSRQQEAALYDHYGYPYYWAGAGLWGAAAYPLAGAALAVPPREPRPAEAGAADDAGGDPHLRSSAEVIDYRIEARDGSIGHVEDFLFDERSWQIEYAVVDTRNWLPGRRVLIAPSAIESIDAAERCARVKLTRAAVEASPPYEPNQPLPDDYIRSVQRHYESWL